MLKCGKCRLVYYCSIDCQKAAWSKHKALCIAFVPKRNMEDVMGLSVGSFAEDEACSWIKSTVQQWLDDDVGVLELAHQRGLGGEEALLEVLLAAVGQAVAAHALDRHLAVVEGVVAEEDLAGGALADLGLHHVLADARRQPRVGGRPGVGRGRGQGQGPGGEGVTGRHRLPMLPARAAREALNRRPWSRQFDAPP
jgi:hypothetical protein